MNDNLIVFAKVKNASITINEEAYPIRLHKLRACFIPYVYIDGYCRAVVIRIFRGEMFAALGELEYSNIKEQHKSISLLEYFIKHIKNCEIDNLKFSEIYEIRNSITKDMDDINVLLCTKISDVDGMDDIKVVLCTRILRDNGVCNYSMKELMYA